MGDTEFSIEISLDNPELTERRAEVQQLTARAFQMAQATKADQASVDTLQVLHEMGDVQLHAAEHLSMAMLLILDRETRLSELSLHRFAGIAMRLSGRIVLKAIAHLHLHEKNKRAILLLSAYERAAANMRTAKGRAKVKRVGRVAGRALKSLGVSALVK